VKALTHASFTFLTLFFAMWAQLVLTLLTTSCHRIHQSPIDLAPAFLHSLSFNATGTEPNRYQTLYRGVTSLSRFLSGFREFGKLSHSFPAEVLIKPSYQATSSIRSFGHRTFRGYTLLSIRRAIPSQARVSPVGACSACRFFLIGALLNMNSPFSVRVTLSTFVPWFRVRS